MNSKKILLGTLIAVLLTVTTAESVTFDKVDPIPRKPVITDKHLLQQQAKVEKIKQTKEGKEVFSLIEHFSRVHGVDHKLVKAIILAESGFNHNATSNAGAQGLMQIKPYKSRLDSAGCYNLYDKHCNIKVGLKHLQGLNAKYGGDLEKVLAGYNAGCGNVDASIRKYGRIPSYTQPYVKKVLEYRVLF